MPHPEHPPAPVAVTLRVTGVVQGVGFRPFVHRLALRHGLAGSVRNRAGEVRIDVEGPAAALDGFVAALRAEAPPLARIAQLEAVAAEPAGRTGFEILPSEDEPDRRLPVPADVAVCAACRREVRDPTDRRFRYPFITCTDCGPRYTVIEALPYDRERTTMRAFRQCAACLAEYAAPGDRRFHSETNSCPACGPRLWWEPTGASGDGDPPVAEAALEAAGQLLDEGGIVAVKGMGGFHLAVDATSESAVRRLRERKHREAKPLAVMVADLAAARELAHVDDHEAALLAAAERPIVLLERRRPDRLAPAVAPGLSSVGVMLPSTPVHDLLLERLGRPVVMTSGNLSDEPIAIGNDEARRRLGPVADGFLLHDREILSRCDDSVLRRAPTGPVFLRRARGFAPLPLALPVAAPRPLVAVGPHLKNTFTLAHGAAAWVSPHVGDLENVEAHDHFSAALARYRALFRVEPEVAVRDLHPGYLSTTIAQGLGLERVIAVQHHHAHVAAVLAEHGRTDRVVGLSFDGTGYGDDGAVWGGEVLLADLTGYRRVGHLREVLLPGGDLAARRPWRAALGWLLLGHGGERAFELAFRGVDPTELSLARWQLDRRVNAPRCTSMGRLFDAAAAILGVRQVAEYEGQAAMELEAAAGRQPCREFAVHLEPGPTGWVIDPLPLLVALGERRLSGAPLQDLAAAFHASLARAAAEVARRACAEAGVRTVALGGGVFQNARLLWSVHQRLEDAGLEVLLPLRLSPNDGAISFGQAAVGAAQLASEG